MDLNLPSPQNTYCTIIIFTTHCWCAVKLSAGECHSVCTNNFEVAAGMRLTFASDLANQMLVKWWSEFHKFLNLTKWFAVPGGFVRLGFNCSLCRVRVNSPQGQNDRSRKPNISLQNTRIISSPSCAVAWDSPSEAPIYGKAAKDSQLRSLFFRLLCPW